VEGDGEAVGFITDHLQGLERAQVGI